jgi:hypothetical protein
MKRGPKHLQISFSGKSLTHFGGLYLLQKFFQSINLRSLLSQYLHFLQRNDRYTAAEEILALVYPIALGLGRIETSHLLRYNGVSQYLTGLPASPMFVKHPLGKLLYDLRCYSMPTLTLFLSSNGDADLSF